MTSATQHALRFVVVGPDSTDSVDVYDDQRVEQASGPWPAEWSIGGMTRAHRVELVARLLATLEAGTELALELNAVSAKLGLDKPAPITVAELAKISRRDVGRMTDAQLERLSDWGDYPEDLEDGLVDVGTHAGDVNTWVLAEQDNRELAAGDPRAAEGTGNGPR